MTNVVTGGVRDTNPATDFSFYNPFLYWQTPYKVAGANVAFFVAESVASVKVNPTTKTDIYNGFFGTNWIWQLNKDFGVGVGLASYAPMHSKVGFNFWTIEERAGVTYTGSGLNLTANLIHGDTFKDTGLNQYVVPDYMLLDLTATKKIGNFEFGAVGFGSTDLTSAYRGYKKQSQFALGGLIGYTFPKFIIQIKATSDIAERNYGGYDKRLWANIIIPLYVAETPSAPPVITEQDQIKRHY